MFESGFLFSANPRCIVDDEDYSHPSEMWMLTTWRDAVDANNRALGLSESIPESNDCDDFADRAVRWAKDSHARMRRPGRGFAVGTFTYSPDVAGGKSHKSVFAIVADREGKPKLLLFEPQSPCRPIQLSEREKATCEKFSV